MDAIVILAAMLGAALMFIDNHEDKEKERSKEDEAA